MGARLLKVGGVTAFTATDYPGQLAAVVFVQGCPWRCAYCHNPHLQARPPRGALHWSALLAKLARRVGLVDAVVFSGGEPTMDPALPDAIAEVKALGFKIGLHTACVYPKRLAAVLPLVDWVGFDIKAPFDRYARITGVADSGAQARACAEAVIASGVEYECRTTIHPSLLAEAEVLELADTLAGMGVDNYALQIFRPQGCGDGALNAVATAGYPSQAALARIGARFTRFTLRRNG
ncbi:MULTISPECIES: anaerobic ribonucleoside-triphosphate reductase activating protein [unclassified Janthinobacterium]|uniref:anaerobic ribonucleoside-triphosphate reductase activating protein n=1 Tax=unclassified Janthinobacterium TaxID=2610881 RepID=UPI000348950E|nr:MULTISPECIES: anaerobic ribonucleoside-triphosphate reductase activating protein [unclassified Janthinobacterium]MEC5160336.1 pyruvate formate lyase activating enzyme [Janthinobacterium sp. CG_S6]